MTIIDEDFSEKPKTNYYRKSLKKLVIAAISVVVSMGIILGFASDDNSFALGIFGGITIMIVYITSLWGFINGIQSYAYKEPYQFKRALVLIINFCFFGIFTLLIFVNIFDLLRFLN